MIRWRRPTWQIRPPRHQRDGREERVTIELAGLPVWFASADAPLAPSLEAAASLHVLPALHHRARLRTAAALDDVWLRNQDRLAPLLASWWGYPARLDWRAAPSRHPAADRRMATGLCFTGGVDSFYALLRDPRRIDYLVFVHGFDIPLADRRRMDAFAGSLQEVAAATGTSPVVVRTNLREHPVFRSVSWERTHGAALAAVGHLLSGHLGRLVIAPSWRESIPLPWGSTPLTDPCWSSSRMQVVHDDARLGRLSRLDTVATHPLVRRHLRVCWENRSPTGNCSQCEKCVRTMVMLAASGALADSEVFDHGVPLAERIAALPPVTPAMKPVWAEVLPRLAPADRQALEKQLQRCCGGRWRPHLLYRRLWRIVRSWMLTR